MSFCGCEAQWCTRSIRRCSRSSTTPSFGSTRRSISSARRARSWATAYALCRFPNCRRATDAADAHICVPSSYCGLRACTVGSGRLAAARRGATVPRARPRRPDAQQRARRPRALRIRGGALSLLTRSPSHSYVLAALNAKSIISLLVSVLQSRGNFDRVKGQFERMRTDPEMPHSLVSSTWILLLYADSSLFSNLYSTLDQCTDIRSLLALPPAHRRPRGDATRISGGARGESELPRVPGRRRARNALRAREFLCHLKWSSTTVDPFFSMNEDDRTFFALRYFRRRARLKGLWSSRCAAFPKRARWLSLRSTSSSDSMVALRCTIISPYSCFISNCSTCCMHLDESNTRAFFERLLSNPALNLLHDAVRYG